MMELTDSEIKRELEQIFEDIMARTEIVFVPDKKDPFNMDKTMVWFITEPDPLDMFIKLELPNERSS